MPGQVAARGRHLDVGRAEPEAAGVAVEHRAEHARASRSAAGTATRRSRSAPRARTSRSRTGSAYSAIGGNGLRRDAPVGRPLAHRRAAAAGSSSATHVALHERAGRARVGRAGEHAPRPPRPCPRRRSGRRSAVLAFTTGSVSVMRDTSGAMPGVSTPTTRPLALAERVVAREQRADVRVRPDAEQDEVERARGPNSSELVLVGGRAVLRARARRACGGRSRPRRARAARGRPCRSSSARGRAARTARP